LAITHRTAKYNGFFVVKKIKNGAAKCCTLQPLENTGLLTVCAAKMHHGY
jgi:hypothetical protein